MLVPKKLKRDAIIEAIVELRFDARELDEVVLGRLLDRATWREFQRARLPLADVPGPIRTSQVGLRYQPTHELRNREATRIVKLGSSVLSYHTLKPYPGWEVLQPELHQVVTDVFEACGEPFEIRRLGLRYINALTERDHGVTGLDGLTLRVTLDDTPITGPQNVNFITQPTSNVHCATRIASPEFVVGPADDFSLLVDIDAYTPPEQRFTRAPDVLEWLTVAHDREKECFFRLLPPSTTQALTEEPT